MSKTSVSFIKDSLSLSLNLNATLAKFLVSTFQGYKGFEVVLFGPKYNIVIRVKTDETEMASEYLVESIDVEVLGKPLTEELSSEAQTMSAMALQCVHAVALELDIQIMD